MAKPPELELVEGYTAKLIEELGEVRDAITGVKLRIVDQTVNVRLKEQGRVVIVHRAAGERLGMKISSDRSGRGVTISHVEPGSPCARTQRLNVGDVVTEVNGRSTLQLGHDGAVDLLKKAGSVVDIRGKQRDANTVRLVTIPTGDADESEGKAFSVDDLVAALIDDGRGKAGAEEYLRRHRVVELLECLVVGLMYHAPRDPIRFLRHKLDEVSPQCINI